jgi:hypothetical protein
MFLNSALSTSDSAITHWKEGWAEPRTGWILCKRVLSVARQFSIQLTLFCKCRNTKESFLWPKNSFKIVHSEGQFTKLNSWFVIGIQVKGKGYVICTVC